MYPNNRNLKGIVLYNIERNGSLNGVFTNIEIPNAEIFTETAKRSNLIAEVDNFRTYDCFYFDLESRRNDCTLEITIDEGIYSAVWVDLDNQRIFEGIGFLMNDKQIAISDWDANSM